MKMFIAGIIILVVLGAIFLADRNGYERGFGAHEAAANQVALQRAKDAITAKDEDIATERQLRHQANQQVEETRVQANNDVALIGAAHAQAVSERDAAHQAIADMEGRQCPEPDKFCRWDSLLPALP